MIAITLVCEVGRKNGLGWEVNVPNVVITLTTAIISSWVVYKFNAKLELIVSYLQAEYYGKFCNQQPPAEDATSLLEAGTSQPWQLPVKTYILPCLNLVCVKLLQQKHYKIKNL